MQFVLINIKPLKTLYSFPFPRVKVLQKEAVKVWEPSKEEWQDWKKKNWFGWVHF